MISDKGHSYGLTEYPNTMRRQADFPIDESSVYDTYNDAKEYVENNPIAYNTQIIGIKETNELFQVKGNSLIPLQTSSINELKYCFGYWSIINLTNDNGEFNMDLLYPIKADKYQLFLNDEAISNINNFNEDFIVTVSLFKDNDDISLKLYQYNYDESANDYVNKELITFNLITTYFNDNVICGILSTYENPIK